ncbi:3-oxoacid CoA-transferase subunit B [Conexibacter sp. JD483]|uniref:3-oxoacid CoA-transferase subunit B n=1 Tax=unclassified Conexibacter TaxID=2627773 RepID=UPI002715826C|nr:MULTISPECIES: 3-oxoacid CoA-transferase subunit B [unclassified Conexibacter]MDO8185577.1 3-oxoacid CoA-transferase subunit B [Conexibacter sp. CPCC 205706]MDO8198750.1 3-oxoacid CoA-transferase subunit B [Conexibacter sp. CPCC 205762]MDR9367900.1 3-oxoacid CoA-transferase subunit B [Conexibacter sp. JD483]
MSETSTTIAKRVARHIEDGEIVNLGIGIPTLVADHLPDGVDVVLQTENGMLGVGPTPAPDDVDPNLVNAGKLPVSELAGASYFASSASFGMIRGGHVDVAILGALQLDGRGRIANWSIPGKPILGVGGAMDLLVGARKVIVATTHLAKDGSAKIVAEASFPLTADRPVDLIVTERATFAVGDQGLTLIDLADGTTVEWVTENTGAPFAVAPELSTEAAA